MARGYGRALDVTTLLVLIRHHFQTNNESAFSVRFEDAGWCSWWGAGLPDSDDLKYFESLDSALLALLIGNQNVPGTDD